MFANQIQDIYLCCSCDILRNDDMVILIKKHIDEVKDEVKNEKNDK